MGDFVQSQIGADRPASASVQRSAMLEVPNLNQWFLSYKYILGYGFKGFSVSCDSLHYCRKSVL